MKSRVSMARALLTRRWPRRRIKLRAPTSDQHDREQMALMCGPLKPSMQPVEGRMPTITYDGDSWLVESAGTNYSRDDQHDMRVRFWCAARRIMVFNRLAFSPQDFEKASTDDLTRSLAAVLRLSAHPN